VSIVKGVMLEEELLIPKKEENPMHLSKLVCLHLQMVFVCDPTKTQILDP
jgi:hypothetical protein